MRPRALHLLREGEVTFLTEIADPFPFPAPIPAKRTYREACAAVERDGALLPDTGPIADLVAAIDVELTRYMASARAPDRSTAQLHRYGVEALRPTGSIRGMRAIHWKAEGFDPRNAQARRDLLEQAWDEIGYAYGVWMA